MTVPLQQAQETVEAAAAELFAADPSIRSVGVTRIGPSFGYHAVRNSAVIVPFGLAAPAEVQGIPVLYTETPGEIASLVRAPGLGPASPSAASLVPEVLRQRPLVGGLQIQNFDDDDRQGDLQRGFIVIGTLSCFVRLADGRPALLSNNHVVAGENRGVRGSDRILQPGSLTFQAADQVAVLTDFVPLQFSPAGASPQAGTAVFNEVDAGVAALEAGTAFTQGYLPFRNLIAPHATATASPGDQVFKVGRTTGLTFGEVTDVATIVGPVAYDPGPCWFRRSLVIEGISGTLFSDRGDSGSAIVRPNGEVVGILYAGNGQQTYACPIDAVFSALSCSLA